VNGESWPWWRRGSRLAAFFFGLTLDIFPVVCRTLPAAKRAGIAVTTEAKGRSLNSAAARGRECWACNILERILTLLTADFLSPPFVLRFDFATQPPTTSKRPSSMPTTKSNLLRRLT
jgi:hypothetical protein